MGILRKTVAGTLAAFTGGASLAAVQFRSDTERGTRETKKLRKEIGRQGQSGGTTFEVAAPNVAPSVIQGMTADEILHSDAPERPTDTNPGWKPTPGISNQERFWNGTKWTSLSREK